MAQSRTYRHTKAGKRRGNPVWLRLLKGLGVSALVSVAGVAVFALLMQWVRPTEGVVRLFNQALKLVSIVAGVWMAVGCGEEGGLLRGAAVGLLYMAAGLAIWTLLSGQTATLTGYMADLGMGVAGGGIAGMILSNISQK